MPTYKNIDYSDNNDANRGGIFRQLQQFFNRVGFFGKEINTNSDDRILTGYEKVQQDVAKELSTAQQNIYDRLNKNYEVSQIERYREFENMERVAEVSAALDLIADETVQIGDNDHVLKIMTKNEKVREELEKLFFETLKIDNDAWDKVRTMCLYGNRFEEIVINKKDPGVLYLNYIDPASIERREEKGRLVCFEKVNYQDRDLRVTVYPEKETEGAKIIQPFRIVHYHIEDSRYKPYGRSVLEPCRRTIRQLNMMEDAMTTYRYSRASEKRVWQIDCGELGPDEAMRYTQEVRDKLRKKPKWNPRTGELDWEMNPLSITEDFFIPMRTGMTNNAVQQLGGAQNLGEIDDVLYFKKKLFFALKIPLAFIGEEGINLAKSNLALLDIRFARMIERIQRYFVKALEKVAIVHLLLRRFTVDDIKSFYIEMTPASNIKKLTDIEFMNNKFGAIGTAKGLELFPDIWLLTNIWGATEEEAENLLKMMKIQKAGGDAEAGMEGGAVGGGGGDLGMGPEALGPDMGAGGEGEMPPGEEVAGGEAGEGGAPGETPGGAEEGGELAASYDPGKNPYAYILTDKLKNNPKLRKKVLNEYYEAWNKVKEKETKKTDKKKVNIVNERYRSFTIFGEITGAKEHREELDKLLFESKKALRRKK